MLTVFVFVCVIISERGDEFLKKNPLDFMYFIPGFLVMVGFNCYVGRQIPKMLDLLLQKGKFNKKFKRIFDNLDETILIINQNQN